jgi:hypothetical protein
MKIQIELVDKQNDLIEMSIEPYWTVSWLKALLVKETNEPMALQHLFFNGLFLSLLFCVIKKS